MHPLDITARKEVNLVAIKAKVANGEIVVTGRERGPLVVNLPFDGMDLVGFEEGAGGYACPDRHPSTPTEVSAGDQGSIITRRVPQKIINLEGF